MLSRYLLLFGSIDSMSNLNDLPIVVFIEAFNKYLPFTDTGLLSAITFIIDSRLLNI